jgi:hypothetical protein
VVGLPSTKYLKMGFDPSHGRKKSRDVNWDGTFKIIYIHHKIDCWREGVGWLLILIG